MAVKYFLDELDPDGLAVIKIRVQNRVPKIDVKQKTPLRILPRIWNFDRNDPKFNRILVNPEIKKIFDDTDEIRRVIDGKISAGDALTAKDVREVIDAIVYADIHEQKRKEEEERRLAEERANKMTLTKFIDIYLEQIASGARQTDKGTNYSNNSVKSIKTSLMQWKEFQNDAGREYDFEDIDIQAYYAFTAFLKKKNYSVNTIGKCIANLKVVMEAARSEKYHRNTEYTDKKFKATRVEVDSIYLSREDLDKLMAVDCSKVLATVRAMDAKNGGDELVDDKQNGKGYELARDIFIVGCWTAQRVSDYNNIKKDQIETYTRKYIAQEPDPANPGKTIDVVKSGEVTVINIRQQKTGAKVTIPCSTQLLAILKKYDFNIPHLADQCINDYIKMVAKAAGMTEKVEIMTTKGGTPKKEFIPKYELIHTHTARRTGATLMYLAGLDLYDIMKITGHSSPAMLKKYIKANELQVAEKIIDKYSYFD